MHRRLAQLKLLSWYEWRLLLTAMILLPLTTLALHLFSFKRTQSFLSRFVHTDRGMGLPEGGDLQKARVIARMVAIAANHGIYRANCLKQSLVTCWLLARHGILSEIKIGVNKEGTGSLKAHAWVELGGGSP